MELAEMITRNTRMKYENHVFFGLKLWPMLKFEKCQSPRLRSRCKIMVHVLPQGTHVKYESPVLWFKKSARIKFFLRN